ncbi:uncharacterized protein N0V89_006909 [Didymosphaeria variabile]|uniref:FAR-17a/AIG1-like protein n=1 Tax=Didymosphaeria variabile TaxID=1932322 RepID=A0A9W9CAC2_9PLEO|nr:uncharacterized protein N0V89_006909 [Didymosphaeria variabile]KAJ4351566.1 hypothetical protein N0V89_006909 [Didymosphaeria variabile]
MAPWTRKTSGRDGGFDPTYRFATSWIVSPAVLFFARALLSLYAFATQFYIFGWNGTHGRGVDTGHSFSYFTILTYWGLAFYFAFAALHTGSYWLTGKPFLHRWIAPLRWAHSAFYSTIVVYPFIVTAVFWALLAPENGFASTKDLWSNTSQHALNSFYALFEIVFPRTEPLPFLHIIVIVIVLALYLSLAYLTHALQGWYTYDFLDLSKHSGGVVAGYIVGILVGSIIVFLIVRYLILLRLWLTEKKLGMTGKFSSRDQRGVRDEEAGKHVQMHSINVK